MAKKASRASAVRKPAPAAAAPRTAPVGKEPVLPGVSETVALTRGVTVASALEHQRKRAIARCAELGVPVGTPVKVRAKKTVYHHDRRYREGDVFTVLAEHFSPKSMERVGNKVREGKPTGPNEALAREHDLIVGGKVTRQADDDDDEPAGPAD